MLKKRFASFGGGISWLVKQALKHTTSLLIKRSHSYHRAQKNGLSQVVTDQPFVLPKLVEQIHYTEEANDGLMVTKGICYILA